jgi:hypothetical protein
MLPDTRHMNENGKELKKSTYFDRRWLILAVLLIAIGAPLLISESLFRTVFGTRAHPESELQVAEVTLKENDVRVQGDGEWAWSSVQKGEGIFVGDGVFSGEKSRAQLSLKVGGTLELGENSLIVFSQNSQLEPPQFSSGDFKLSLRENEKSKFRFNDEVIEVQGGLPSEVQLNVDEKGGSRLTVIKGEIRILKKGVTRTLSFGASIELEVAPKDSFQSWKKAPRGKESRTSNNGRGWLRDPQSLEPEPPQLKPLEEMRAPAPSPAMPRPIDDIQRVETLKPRK